MKNHPFFAMLSRMKYITRWGLMRNTRPETLPEHVVDVCILTHALAALGNSRLKKHFDTGRAVMLALYHDSTEIITGDLPTPIKYFDSHIKKAYKDVERDAGERLLSMLPAELKPEYCQYLLPGHHDQELLKLVKAADKLSALIKCMEELQAGNREFSRAYQANLDAVAAMDLEEANLFLAEFLPSYGLSLDELDEGEESPR